MPNKSITTIIVKKIMAAGLKNLLKFDYLSNIKFRTLMNILLNPSYKG